MSKLFFNVEENESPSKCFSRLLKRTIALEVEPKRVSNLVRKAESFLKRGGSVTDAYMKRTIKNDIPGLDFICVVNGSLKLLGDDFELLNKHVIKLCEKQLSWVLITEYLLSYTNSCITSDTLRSYYSKSRKLLNNLRRKKKICEREEFLNNIFNVNFHDLNKLSDVSFDENVLNSTRLDNANITKSIDNNESFSNIDESIIESELNESRSSMSSFCEEMSEIHFKEKQVLEKRIEILDSKYVMVKNENKEIKSHYNIRNIKKREVRKIEKIKKLSEKNASLEDSLLKHENKLNDVKYLD